MKKVAVIGAGPTGILLCDKLLKNSPATRINLLDRRFSPYGLIRYGVAPDHVDIKNYSRKLHLVLQNDSIKFYGGINVGQHINLAELKSTHDAIVFCTGMFGSKFPSASLIGKQGCMSATDIVKWYNGEEALNLPAKMTNIAIVGNGNVAADVARVLLTDPRRLSKLDIAQEALDHLSLNPVKSVTIFGRRSPWDASFTVSELRQLLDLPDVEKTIDFEARTLDEMKDRRDLPRKTRRLLDVWLSYLKNSSAKSLDHRTLTFKFNHQLNDVQFCVNDGVNLLFKDKKFHDHFDAVIFCIGFTSELSGVELPMTRDGRIETNPDGQIPGHPGCFAAGWAATGPQGILAHSLACAESAAPHVRLFLNNLGSSRSNDFDLLLKSKSINWVSKQSWDVIDSIEMVKGSFVSAVRRKMNAKQASELMNKLG